MAAVALLLHGAGSCPETARRLLGPAVPDGAQPVALQARGSVEDAVAALEAAASGRQVALVAGVSLGAHAAALWAARGGTADMLVLAMPAWTGGPGPVAALTASSAEEVRRRGRVALLAQVAARAPHDWVVDELRRGWATYDDDALASALEVAASSTGPTLDELARVRSRTAVVALADDPLHPEGVARGWARAVPGARLAVVGRHEPAADRGALGRAGTALLAAPGPAT